MTVNDVLIIGSGPAGLTAALYAARANLKPVVISGAEAGGQLMLTTDVENYPGFPDGIQGPEMMDLFRRQAERFGTRFIDDDVSDVDFSSRPFKVQVGKEWHQAKSVIIATGASARWLGLESETRLRGRGVSSCATCDGFFFKDGKILVVGGGDSAMEEALYLEKIASAVTVIHRRDELRASKIMQERAMRSDKISFVWDSAVDEVLGDQSVTGVRVKNLKTDETTDMEADAMFVAIGHIPNTKFLQGCIELNDEGYIEKYDGMRTSVEGVFVAGDAHDFRYRQAVTAAGDGCKAALEAERWLGEQEGAEAAAAEEHAASQAVTSD